MCDTINVKCSGTVDTEIHGMIDGNAHHNSMDTWPKMLEYRTVDKNGNVETINLEKAIKADGDKENIIQQSTRNIGDNLVKLNTEMYNKKIQMPDDCDIDNKNIPSLIIAPTMDMEFAKYYGDEDAARRFLLKVGQTWEGRGGQVEETEAAVVANPLRLFPLYSYDPRRFWRDSVPPVWLKGYDHHAEPDRWDYPFSHIVGCGETTPDRIWLGFCMNPLLGFRPFDELCDQLPMFYEACDDNNIPILAHCSPDGFLAHKAESYNDFDIKMYLERIKKSKGRDAEKARCSNEYCGRERIVKNDLKIDHFYRNYGHPRNWIPVLERWPDLHLCFSHFGGNSEWCRDPMSKWADINTKREWIRCIIKLTQCYKNVYADISGLNIYNDDIKKNLQGMLCAICKSDDYMHLRYKLIFGTNWYFTRAQFTKKHRTKKYSEYCELFEELFEKSSDIGKELWEYVSLFNPWRFYGLSKEKFQAIHSVLPQVAKEKATPMLTVCDELGKHIPPFYYNPKKPKGEDPAKPEGEDPAKPEGKGPAKPKKKDEDLGKDEDLEPIGGNASCGRSKDEITCGSCGIVYRGEIRCTTIDDTIYGPRYWGNLSLEGYGDDKWRKLIANNVLTREEKDIIIGVSKNEGKLDAVQSYDSEVVSVGAMQKTINSLGMGEFVVQMAKFSKIYQGKENNKFKFLFENCGWILDHNSNVLKKFYDEPDVTKGYKTFQKEALREDSGLRVFYEDRDCDGNIKRITGEVLKRRIREGFGRHNVNRRVECIPIEPLINALKDPDFQVIQIEDFVATLHVVLEKKPTGYEKHSLHDYLKSAFGKAVALDQQVNRPKYVAEDFGKALERFYNRNPAVSQNPNEWRGEHNTYEGKIIEEYGPHRNGKYMKKRYDDLKARFKSSK